MHDGLRGDAEGDIFVQGDAGESVEKDLIDGIDVDIFPYGAVLHAVLERLERRDRDLLVVMAPEGYTLIGR